MLEVSSSKPRRCWPRLSVGIDPWLCEPKLHTNHRKQGSAREMTQRIRLAYMTRAMALGLDNTHGKAEQGNYASGLRGCRLSAGGSWLNREPGERACGAKERQLAMAHTVPPYHRS